MSVRPSSPSLCLDTTNQCLWRGQSSISVTPRAFALLVYLADRPKRLVMKEELLDRVWAGTSVTDGVLKVCVRELRKALGDDVKAPSFIETAHRRGYRFVGELPRREGPPGEAEAVRPESARSAPNSIPPTFPVVGRDDLFAELEAARQQALGAARRLCFLCGPPGIGKTTAVDAFLRSAAGLDGAWIARGQCIEHYGSGEAYLPVLDALGRLLRSDVREPALRWLERDAPTWLAPLGALSDSVNRDSLERRLLGATRERMLREMAEALERLSLERPFVLVLEDLHWSDFSTLDLLALLGRRREPARLLVLGTYRPGDVLRTSHPLKEVVRELDTHALCTRLELDTLPRPAIDDYLARRFPGHDFPRELADGLYKRTEGSPLFLAGLVDLLAAERSIVQRDGAWHFEGDLRRVADKLPETVRQVIEMQVERLSSSEQRMLDAASLVGAEFSAASVAAALDLPQAEIEETCDSLVDRQQMLSPSAVCTFPLGHMSARYSFRHALYSSALYHRIAPSRRARWHLRIARRGEELFGQHVARIAAELAVHCEEGHDATGAVKHRLLAARTDARRHANREAVEHLVRAGTLLERIAEPQRSEMRLEVLEELGVTRRSMGDMQGSSEAFEELARAATNAGQRALRIRALLYLASTLFWVDRDRCLAVVDKTLESSRELDDELLVAHVRGYCGHWSLNLRGFDPEHARAGELAVAAARKADDRALLALHVVRNAYTQIVQGRHREALETTREGCELALAVGDAFDFLLCRFFRGWALLHAGGWGEMRSMLADSIELAERNGHSLWSALLRLETSQLHEAAYDHATAASLAEQALGLARGSDAPTGQILFHGLIALARARVGEGRDAEAERCFREIEERLRGRGAWMDWMLYFPLLEARSRWRTQRGELERAQIDAVELLRRAMQSGEATYAARAHVALAEIALRRDDPSRAERELDQGAAFVERAPIAAPSYFVARSRCQRALSRARDATRSAREAVRLAAQAVEGLESSDPLLRSWLSGVEAQIAADGPAPRKPVRAK